jgi:hypothetical protein
LKLTEKYFNSTQKRTLTTDNFFSSMKLADTLLNKNISFVGTMRRNKVEIPWQFLPMKSRALYSSVFGFNEAKTLVSYVPRMNKGVILISTEHHSSAINIENHMKPEIIEFYNQTKGGVFLFNYILLFSDIK